MTDAASEPVKSITLEIAFERALGRFKEHVEHDFKCTVTDYDALRLVVINNLSDIVELATNVNTESGWSLDELYGDDMVNCIAYDDADDDDS